MANGVLRQIKRMITRWQSSSRLSLTRCGGSLVCRDVVASCTGRSASFSAAEVVPEGMRPVYVGKSHRRYLVPADLVNHPMFQILIDRFRSDGATIVISCHVRMLEQMLWTLEDSDPQRDSIDEIVEN